MAATEKVGIEIELMGGQEAFDLLKRIDGAIDTLNKKRKFKSLSGLSSAKSELESYMKELEKLNKEQEKWQNLANKVGKGNMSAFGVREWDRVKGKIDETKGKIKQMKAEMDSVTEKTRTFGQVFKSVSSTVAHVGSAMQSLGNALTRLSSPFRRLTSGFIMGAGYKALNLVTEGLGGAFERADTMKNYSRTLKAFFGDTEDVADSAEQAIQRLNDAVLGLPTGLDEIVAVQKRFLAASQDIEKSTDLAIAYNNAILASGSDARQQKTAQRILTQLAGGAEIASSSWDALQRAIPLVFTALAKEADVGVSDYVSALKTGKITTDEFVKSFTRIGQEGAISAAAEVMKKSWGGLQANITNRFKAMGEGIIESLHEVFTEQTGRDLLDTLLGIDAEGNRTYDGLRDWIDGISESAQNWIKANPDRIIDFFNKLKAVDWKGLLKGIAEGTGQVLDLIMKFADWMSGKDLSRVGRIMPKMSMLGWILSTLGGVLKGLRHPLGFLGALAIKGVEKGGILGKIASIFGKKKDIETAAEAGGAITKASPKLVNAFKNMALLSGIVAMPAVTGFVVTGAVKQSIKSFKDTINLLKDMDWSAAAKVAGGIAGYLGASAGIGYLVGKYGVTAGTFTLIGETLVGLITSIASGFFDANMALIKGGIKNFVDSVNLLKEIPDVSGFGDVASKIGNAVDMINEISRLLDGRYVDKGVKEGGVQGVNFLTGMSIGSIAKALSPLKEAVQNINELASMSIPPNAPSRISTIIDGVTEISQSLGRLWGFGFGTTKTNISNIADAVFELRRVIYHIGKISGEKINKNGIKNVREAIEQIGTAFDASAIADIRSKLTGFVASIQDAFTMLDKLNTPLEIKASVKLSGEFKRSVDAVVRDIGLARQRIRLAWAGIPTSFSKTITFTLNARVVADNLYSGASKAREIAESVHPAKGGLIYRAHGGSIFKRRGTDTVPAMLTPGEYVHNKRAVNTFGIDFMRKVNNLDVKGAMNELMHRAGHMANVNRGTTINNITNNNQKVNITNNGNPSAGYTFKRASRFVGAI